MNRRDAGREEGPYQDNEWLADFTKASDESKCRLMAIEEDTDSG